MTDDAGAVRVDPILVLGIDPRLTTPGYFFALTDALGQLPDLQINRAWSPTAGRTFSAEPDFLLFSRLMTATSHVPLHGRIVNTLCRLTYRNQLARLAKFVRTERHSLVHINWSFSPEIELPFVREIQSMGIPVVFTAHNAVPHGRTDPSGAAVELYRAVDHIVALTEYVKNEILEGTGLPNHRVTVIPHGDFTADVMPSAPASAPTPPFPGHRTVVCLGMIRPYKGVPDLLDAWPFVLEACPDARLIVAGRLYWEARREVHRAWRRLDDLQSTVHREFDYLPGDRFGAYLEAATLLVQPYRSASQSGNTVHAYGKGVPVVCTRVGGLPEMVDTGRTGAVAESNSPESLAAAIVGVLEANANGELSEHCREMHRTQYNWRTIARTHRDLYRGLVFARAHPSRD